MSSLGLLNQRVTHKRHTHGTDGAITVATLATNRRTRIDLPTFGVEGLPDDGGGFEAASATWFFDDRAPAIQDGDIFVDPDGLEWELKSHWPHYWPKHIIRANMTRREVARE